MFIPGDRILSIDDDISGKIIKINGSKCLVRTCEGFEIEFESHEIILDRSPKDNLDFSKNFYHLSKQNSIRQTTSKNTDKITSRKKRAEVPSMEIDLHIEKLIKHTKGLSNFDFLNIQIDSAKRFLHLAVSKKISKVIFIHGVGEGVLKAELEYELKRLYDIEIREADFRKYGNGALEVYIPQSSFSKN